MVANRYTHIADQLRVQIGRGLLAADDRLPSEAELMTEFGASRPTVRLALDILQNEGLIVRRHGSGNFVRQPVERITYTDDKLSEDTRTTVAAAVKVPVSTKVVEADNSLCVLLGVPRDTRLTEYVYRSYQGSTPYSLARIYVPAGVLAADVPRTSASPLGDDVRAALTSSGVQLAATQSRITARLATAEEARTLQIGTGTAVLDIERVSLDPAGRVVEAALLVLPSYSAQAVFTTHSLVRDLEAA
ncbi:GntR family transcriptional regulator [Streptomyces colonosanans]|nr:GntR family transcriptional regulator [Streptomyces colonosanans]